jgi:hypothetical protein
MPRRPKRIREMLADPQSIALPADLHPLVVAWMERDRQNEEQARKENREAWAKREDTFMGRRRLRICDALFKAAEEKGYGLERPDGYLGPVSLRIKGQCIEWSLEEQISSKRVPLSKKELKRPDNIARGITTQETEVPTGTFKLVATAGHRMKARIWERTDKPIESRIEEVLGRFEKLADAAIADEIRSAEIHRRVEEEIKAKERPRRLKAMEEARWDRLRKLTGNWHEAESLHAFIDAVERALGDAPQSGREIAWLAWARKRAERLDPLSRGAASARDIAHWHYDPHPSEYELSVWELD